MKIEPEVSQIDTTHSVATGGISIPALTVRRAETTVELPSGGSIAIAGLLQNDIQNTIRGLPFLKDIPILGSLFSSTEFQRSESDLVIAVIVTTILGTLLGLGLARLRTRSALGGAADVLIQIGRAHV